MKKRILSFFALAIMGISAFLMNGCGWSDGVSLTFVSIKDGAEYEARSSIGWANGVGEVPAEYKGKPVTSIGNGGFRDALNFIALTLPSTIDNIGESAFTQCPGLTVILKSVVPPMQNESFKNTKLIVVPAASLDSYKEAWSEYSGKIVPDSYIINGKYVINSNNVLISYISDEAVATVPEAATGINSRAFYNNLYLKEVRIPKTVTDIALYENRFEAVVGCANLEKVVVASENENFCSINDVLYNIQKTRILSVPPKLTGHVVIPEEASYLNNSGLFSGTNITGITLPRGFTRIISKSFANCTELVTVNLPDDLDYIGEYCFERCNSLSSITIPASVTQIGTNIFYNTYRITVYLEIAENEVPEKWASNWHSGKILVWGE